MRIRRCGTVFGSILLLCVALGSAAPPEPSESVEQQSAESPGSHKFASATGDGDTSGVEVTRDDAEGLIHIRFTATDGRLEWSDIHRAVTRTLSLDETAFQSRLPHGSIDLDGRAGRTTLRLASLAVPGVRMERIAGDDGAEPQLLVTIDRDRLQSVRRRGKGLLRRTVTGNGQGADARFGLAVDETWASAPAGVTRVVLLHGFNASALSIEPLAEELRRQGHPCAVATYPNDQAINQCARRLSGELDDLLESAGPSSIALVTNSTGGLVARRMLEDPRLDPGGIDRLIMIAPPNSGSNLARVALGTDVWEHCLRSSGLKPQARFYRSIDDGLGEAARDLRPDSPFLRQLNAKDRNPRIAYTIVLGDRGKLSEAELQRLRESLKALSERSETIKLLSPRIDKVLADLDEVVEGKGDGVVSLKRGRLAGVDDVHVLHCSHDVARTLSDEAGGKLLKIVVERLK